MLRWKHFGLWNITKTSSRVIQIQCYCFRISEISPKHKFTVLWPGFYFFPMRNAHTRTSFWQQKKFALFAELEFAYGEPDLFTSLKSKRGQIYLLALSASMRKITDGMWWILRCARSLRLLLLKAILPFFLDRNQVRFFRHRLGTKGMGNASSTIDTKSRNKQRPSCLVISLCTTQIAIECFCSIRCILPTTAKWCF